MRYPGAMSFSDLLRAIAERRGLALPPGRHPEPLAGLRYREELELKQEALAAFWREERLPGRPEPLIPAPVPRGYRTTTKRRVVRGARGLVFTFPGARPLAAEELDADAPAAAGTRTDAAPGTGTRVGAPPASGGRPRVAPASGKRVGAAPDRPAQRERAPRVAPEGFRNFIPGLLASALDPLEHLRLYAFLLHHVGQPAARPLAKQLNWVVVRGAPGALAVILNLRLFDARVVRAAKALAEALQAEARLGVRAAFLYLDPTASEYYLEARRPAGALSFKRLFGPDRLEAEAAGVLLRFPPTVFSQVNGPMLGAMVETAAALLGPLRGHTLLDLFCGYGLFSLTAGREASRVVGVDYDAAAIEAARGNAERLRAAGRMRFLAGRIDGEFLARRIDGAVTGGLAGSGRRSRFATEPARSRPPEAVLLDPPRKGTAEGVAETIAARAPRRIVHICCGTDEIPREIAAWARVGYRVQRVAPLDLFAGTLGLETMLLLAPYTPRGGGPAAVTRSPRPEPSKPRGPGRDRPGGETTASGHRGGETAASRHRDGGTTASGRRGGETTASGRRGGETTASGRRGAERPGRRCRSEAPGDRHGPPELPDRSRPRRRPE